MEGIVIVDRDVLEINLRLADAAMVDIIIVITRLEVDLRPTSVVVTIIAIDRSRSNRRRCSSRIRRRPDRQVLRLVTVRRPNLSDEFKLCCGVFLPASDTGNLLI